MAKLALNISTGCLRAGGRRRCARRRRERLVTYRAAPVRPCLFPVPGVRELPVLPSSPACLEGVPPAYSACLCAYGTLVPFYAFALTSAWLALTHWRRAPLLCLAYFGVLVKKRTPTYLPTPHLHPLPSHCFFARYTYLHTALLRQNGTPRARWLACFNTARGGDGARLRLRGRRRCGGLWATTSRLRGAWRHSHAGWRLALKVCTRVPAYLATPAAGIPLRLRLATWLPAHMAGSLKDGGTGALW